MIIDEVLGKAPPECQTHSEKIAFAFGWFKAMEQIEAVVLAEREACAKVCDEIAISNWDAYKGRIEPVDRDKLYNPHIEGMSDGADECAAAIRARSEK